MFSKSVPSKVKQRIHNVFPYSGGSKSMVGVPEYHQTQVK
ncbi:hypothetical protein JCM19233_4909 [Vibrio astriarenae]|nr:hypothetical protein JCM19233_4909 [Vibrio sp. C7]